MTHHANEPDAEALASAALQLGYDERELAAHAGTIAATETGDGAVRAPVGRGPVGEETTRGVREFFSPGGR